MSRDELKTTLTMLRDLGVSKYIDTPGEGFTVEFFKTEAQPDAPKVTNDPDICPCKHHLHTMHMNGFCVEGCEPEQCNPVPKP